VQDCIDVIDVTHITARVSRAEGYMGMKNYTSQNLLVVVDFDMRVYIRPCWMGSICT
jgi:hypothetical protein